MKNNNFNIYYGFDFSKNDNDEFDEDDNFKKLMHEMLTSEGFEESEKSNHPLIVDKEKVDNFCKALGHLIYIAKENEAAIKIKGDTSTNRICIELECEVFDFDTPILKKFISFSTNVSKFTTIESKTDGKTCMIFEFEIFK